MAAGQRRTKKLRALCFASKPLYWARIMFRLVRGLRPESGLELGTCLGVSAAYKGAAMRFGGRGHLTTCEGAPALAERSRENLRVVGLSDIVDVAPGRFDDTIAGVLARIAPVDYAFIDGHHDERATLACFDRIFPALADSALIVFDDIAWSAGMERAWARIAKDPRVTAAVDLGQIGVILVERGQSPIGTFYFSPFRPSRSRLNRDLSPPRAVDSLRCLGTTTSLSVSFRQACMKSAA